MEQETKSKIIFSRDGTKFVLEAFGFKTDRQGFITSRGKRLIATDGKIIRWTRLGGIVKNQETGKPDLVRDDLWSIMDLVDKEKKKTAP